MGTVAVVREGLPFLVVGMTRLTSGVESDLSAFSYTSRRSAGYEGGRVGVEDGFLMLFELFPIYYYYWNKQTGVRYLTCEDIECCGRDI